MMGNDWGMHDSWWMMGGMWIFWLLILVLVVLGIAALSKYLSRR